MRRTGPRGSSTSVRAPGEIGYAYPAYTASKGGVIALTRQLAAELAPHRITVNVVNPGFIRTPINDDAFTDPAQAHRVAERIPLGRMGHPDEVAAVASPKKTAIS